MKVEVEKEELMEHEKELIKGIKEELVEHEKELIKGVKK